MYRINIPVWLNCLAGEVPTGKLVDDVVIVSGVGVVVLLLFTFPCVLAGGVKFVTHRNLTYII